MKFNLEQTGESTYNVKTNGGLKLGEFYREVDGFFVFWPVERAGFYSEEYLGALLFELQQLNAPWKENIRKYFDNEGKSKD